GALASQLGASGLSCQTVLGARWYVAADCTVAKRTDKLHGTQSLPLLQFKVEAGGFWLASVLPLGEKYLLVTNQDGAFVLSDRGEIAQGWQGGNWKAVEVRGKKEAATVPEVKPWAEGPMTTMLARSASDGRVLMTFWRGRFSSTVALVTTKLQPVKLITFVGEVPTKIQKLSKAGWRVTLS